ncbi:MAG TPA: cation:proton antiporter [Candidatus Polarisedimenticolia bacterium]|jgi:Kef-type K+ transport system membrane component KefB
MTGGRGLARRFVLFALLTMGGASILSLAASGEGAHHDPVASVILSLVVILIGAKLGGEIFERIGQPAVLGELVAGVLIGNLDYLTGVGFFTGLRADPFIDIFARVGVIVLLFQVGLETRVADMLKVGASATLVASLGVIVPTVLGLIVGESLLPDMSFNAHLFLGATLAATSVGITARVLKDLGRLQDRESQIILGAAVIDDVLGLILLAVVSGIVTAGSITPFEVARITGVSILFLGGALLAGPTVVRLFVAYSARMRVRGMKVITALSFCFGLAYLADLIGLAPIVGAFAAGLVLEEASFQSFSGQRPLEETLDPFSTFFVPIFFVLMGIQVRLETFVDPAVLGLAAAITVAAVVGKQVCSLGVLEKGLDRISVGVGMIPRGEVGLIFASIGRGLGVVDDRLFSATVMMVIVTTFITPPALKLTMGRWSRKRARAAAT